MLNSNTIKHKKKTINESVMETNDRLIDTGSNNSSNDLLREKVSSLVDSGERTQFESGAMREMNISKGRFDLIPFDILGNVVDDNVYKLIGKYMETKDAVYLEKCLRFALNIELHLKDRVIANEYEFLMDLAKHFEEDALKYDPDNWRKGLPVSSFIDSACRHYCKHKLGHTDEPHFIAFTWNIICAIWTIKNIK